MRVIARCVLACLVFQLPAAMADDVRMNGRTAESASIADIRLVADSMDRYFRTAPPSSGVSVQPQPDSLPAPKLQASIRLHTAEELRVLLARAETLTQTLDGYPDREPIAFVLHGDEIELFRHENYQMNRDLVDLAARLEAYQVVDLKVCEAWMEDHHLEGDQLPAFLDRIQNGPDEVKRLEAAGYSYF